MRDCIGSDYGTRRVAELERADIDTHRRKYKATPTKADYLRAVWSSLLNLAVELKWRPDNPTKPWDPRWSDTKRVRRLSPAELDQLLTVLDNDPCIWFANVIRIALLTGARRSEVLQMRWNDVDLDSDRPSWTKPSSAVKQKRMHYAPLNPQVVALLKAIRDEPRAPSPGRRGGYIINRLVTAGETGYLSSRSRRYRFSERRRPLHWTQAGILDNVVAAPSPFVFPSALDPNKPVTWRSGTWDRIRKAARLADFHAHDLRHNYASVMASNGNSLLVIGAALGHSSPRSTARYAHLTKDDVRDAIGAAGAQIIPLKQRQG